MTKARAAKTGLGEYKLQEERLFPLRMYLKAIEESAPIVLEELWEAVRPHYWSFWRAQYSTPEMASPLPYYRALRRWIVKWRLLPASDFCLRQLSILEEKSSSKVRPESKKKRNPEQPIPLAESCIDRPTDNRPESGRTIDTKLVKGLNTMNLHNVVVLTFHSLAWHNEKPETLRWEWGGREEDPPGGERFDTQARVVGYNAARLLNINDVTWTLTTDCWNPFNESRAEAMERMLWDLKHQLNRRYDDLEAKLDRLAPTVVPTQLKTGTKHFNWLVRYQVLGESMGDIVKKGEVLPNGRTIRLRRQSVDEGIRSAADLLFGPAAREWLKLPKREKLPKRRKT